MGIYIAEQFELTKRQKKLLKLREYEKKKADWDENLPERMLSQKSLELYLGKLNYPIFNSKNFYPSISTSHIARLYKLLSLPCPSDECSGVYVYFGLFSHKLLE